jgi:hypothetical protein
MLVHVVYGGGQAALFSLQSKLHELVVVHWHNVLRALACGGYVNKCFFPGISG